MVNGKFHPYHVRRHEDCDNSWVGETRTQGAFVQIFRIRLDRPEVSTCEVYTPRIRQKRTSEDEIQTAISVLERMSKSGQMVQVMVVWPLFMVTFEASIAKHENVEDLFTLNAGEFTITVSPRLAETLLFHPDGGLFLERDRMAITIEPEEHSAEELVERYPGANRLIH